MIRYLSDSRDALGALSEVWAEGMWRACWQGALAIALAWALCRALGERLPSRLRPWPWRLAALKMLLCLLAPAPLALRVLPPASRAPNQSLPANVNLSQTRALSRGSQGVESASGAALSNRLGSAQARPRARAEDAASTSSISNNALTPSISSAANRSAADVEAAVSGAEAAASSSSQVALAEREAPAQVLAARSRGVAEPSARAALWPSVLLLVWLGGVCWSLARLAHEGAHASRWRRECKLVLDDSAQGVLGEMCARLKVRRAPLLLRSNRGGPLLLGLSKPAIVLPQAMLEPGARAEMQLALAHETAHHKRRDLAWNILLCVSGTLFWFHPALWLARREWKAATEQACDELALHATRMPAASYGALLLQVAARRPASVASWGAVGVAEADDYALLRRRIVALSGAGRSSKRALRLGAALLGASTLGLAPWHITAREATTEAPVSTSTTSPRAVGADRTAASTSTPTRTRRSALMSPALAPTGEKVEVTVLSPSGQPVAGARVLWAQLDEASHRQRTETFTADTRGRLIFPIGRVRRGKDFVHQAILWAQAPGFGPTRYDITPPRTTGPEVIRLRPASTLRLSLRDSRGRPVPNIYVQVWRLSDGEDWPTYAGYRGVFGAPIPSEVVNRFHSRTDARGQAVIAGLPLGASVYLALSYALPGDNSPRAKYLRARPSRFAPLGSESSVLMSTSSVSHSITMLTPAIVRGRVTFPDGSPVVGAVVEPSRPGAQTTSISDLPKAFTNRQGRYSMGGLRPGIYKMKVSRGKKLEREWAVANARVQVREGNANRVDLKLVPGAIVRGRVISERTGRPVAGQPLGFRDAAQNYEYKASGPDGAFEFRSVGGEQKLWLRDDQDSAPGFALPVGREFSLRLANGQSRSITFRLPSASAPRAITGQVLGEDNSPAAGASISVEAIGGTPSYGQRAILKADAQGRFVIPARITQRPVRLWASLGSRMSPRGTIAIGGDNLSLRISAGNESQISGRVLDARSQKPIAGAQIVLMISAERNGSQSASAKSDANGRFRFSGLRPGSVYSLSAQARGYSWGNGEPAPPRAGQSVQADILMRRRDSFVAGRALYSDGKPAVGVSISAPGSAKPAVSDAQGRFRLTNVAQGNVFVIVYPPGAREPFYQNFVAGRTDARITIRPLKTPAQAKINEENRAFWKRRRAMIGSMAPEIQARGWVNSEPLSLANLRGQIVLLDFWSDAYGRSRAVRPEVEEIARNFDSRGLRVIGVHHAPEYLLDSQRALGGQVDFLQPPLDVARLNSLSRELGISYALALDAPPARAPRGAREATPSGLTSASYNDVPRVVIDRTGRIAYAGDSLFEAMRVAGELLRTSEGPAR